MPKGIWVWPPDPKGQRGTLRKVASSPHLLAAMTSLAKSKEGMSNSELEDAVGDSSEWTTLWLVRQMTSLGFIELKVDFFGNPARYQLTERGRTALSTITGQVPQKPPPTPVSAPPGTQKPVAPAAPSPSAPRPPQPTVPKTA